MIDRAVRFQSAFAGVAAAVIGFAVTYGLRVFTHAPFLPEITAQFAVEYSPIAFTNFIIGHFGTEDKAVGTAIMFAACFVAAMILGVVFAMIRDRLPGRSALAKGLAFSILPLLVTAVLVAVILALKPAIWAGYTAGPSAFSLILFNVLFGVVLASLAGTEKPEESNAAAALFGRRRALFAIGIAVAAAILTDSILRRLYSSYTQASGTPSGTLPGFITPNATFYQVSKDLSSPRVDASNWKLLIGGNVDRTIQLSYQDLLNLPMIEQMTTLECVSNEVGGPLISTARWRGVPLGALLQRAGLRSNTQEIVLRGVDDYSDSIPVNLAAAPDCIVALFMNGEKLPVDHGFPARLLIPGLFGMENVKWLSAIEPITGRYAGYWQQRGWEKFARANTMSKFLLPQNGARFSIRQPIELAGVAFAGNRGIAAVEVGDGSSWRRAELVPAGSKITWTFWKTTWTAPKAGRYRLMVRATDGTGATQTSQRVSPFPNGATGFHAIDVQGFA